MPPRSGNSHMLGFLSIFQCASLNVDTYKDLSSQRIQCGRLLDVPNACINISISQSPDGSIHVASHTGILIMAPEDRPNELGMLTNRTSYEVPQGVKCEIDEMVRTLQPRYGASETYLKNI